MDRIERRIYRTECQNAYQKTVSRLASISLLAVIDVFVILAYLIYSYLASDSVDDETRLKRFSQTLIFLALLTSITAVHAVWSWHSSKRGLAICIGGSSLAMN